MAERKTTKSELQILVYILFCLIFFFIQMNFGSTAFIMTAAFDALSVLSIKLVSPSLHCEGNASMFVSLCDLNADIIQHGNTTKKKNIEQNKKHQQQCNMKTIKGEAYPSYNELSCFVFAASICVYELCTTTNIVIVDSIMHALSLS